MKVLIACEYSGKVRDAFLREGHDAVSCDILPTETPGPHLQGDVSYVLSAKWDLIIAHPPCTFLCNSGVRWLKTQSGRFEKMGLAAKFFNSILDNPYCEKIAVENPIPHKYGIKKKYTQIIQPWQFGHGETKATCLWLKGLPKLVPTNIVPGRDQRIWKMAPSANRSKQRSETYQGIADAMAQQWGNFPEK